MAAKSLRPLPSEQEGPWPLLQVTTNDRVVTLPETEQARQLRIKQDSYDLFIHDIIRATIIGTLFGFLLFSLSFGLLSTLGFWLAQWHWVWLLGAILALWILIGTRFTLLFIGLGLYTLGSISMISYWLFGLLFIACGICLRTGYELLPSRGPELS